MENLRPFHLACAVADLDVARNFYSGVLGCSEGRSAPTWVDFDFFGHQLVFHLDSRKTPPLVNLVDGHGVPVPHFGVVLTWDDWHSLAAKMQTRGIAFVIEPTIRFKGQVGEQATMFFNDPNGLALEFKAFRDDSSIFAR